MIMSAVHVTLDNFREEVLRSELPVLVDFWADWCAPCMMLAPIIEEISDELDGKVNVCKIDVDQAQDLAAAYGVISIPTLMIFSKGKEVERTAGYMPKEDVLAFVENSI